MTTQLRQPTESRQAEIIATMVALAATRNPAEITTTEIAREMNLTQGALFRHFPTKEAIRLAVIEWIEAGLQKELQHARQSAPDSLKALEAMFMAHVRFARAHPGAPRLVFSELQQPDTSPVRLRVQQVMQRYRQTLAEVIASAIDAKLIRADVDCNAAAALFLGAIQGMVIQSMLGGAQRQSETLVAEVLRLYLTGLEDRQ